MQDGVFTNEMRRIKNDFYIKKRKLERKYADANNPVQVGDIIMDHYQRIRVETIGYYFASSFPSCVYRGPKVRKDLLPFKSGSEGTVHQMNMKHHIKKCEKTRPKI